MLFDILVQWVEVSYKGAYRFKTKWYRGVQAGGILEANAVALASHQNNIGAAVSACWPQWPQSRGN